MTSQPGKCHADGAATDSPTDCRTHQPSHLMQRLLPLVLLASLHLPATLQAAFIPDFKLKPDLCNVLMGFDAKLSSGLSAQGAGAHGKLWVNGWSRPDQQALWEITSDAAADYAVQVLVNSNGQELRLEVAAAGRTLTGTLPAGARRWQRIALPGLLAIPKGSSSVTLHLLAADKISPFNAQVHAVELIRPAVRTESLRRATALRADSTWFQQARYGIMVHWTSQSMPREGEPKPYARAVEDFDVEGFANQMQRTGAGFVVVTTSHAFQYFPAPLAALDRILPGRTSKRDLVADLATALGKRGIKLMLYYHLGAGDDAEWLKVSGFWETDTTKFFNNWRTIISEAGTRYQNKLAGWWFDDGSSNYYYRSAPWESLARAAKAGFPGRMVAFNPWELNSPTPFQDYFTGEGFEDARGYNELLVRGGNGRYPSGTHAGLQASACFTLEGDWVHLNKGQAVNPPKWNAEQLAKSLKEFAAYRSVPIFNLEIYQEGRISEPSVVLFEQARAHGRKSK